MSHFHLLEGQQIWMTFYIYLFRGVDNEIIVSFKFFRLKVLHSYLVEISNETSLKPQMKCRNFMFLIGRKVEWLFIFLFFFMYSNRYFKLGNIVIRWFRCDQMKCRSVLLAKNYTFVHTRLKFKTKPRWNPRRNIAFSCTWRAANLNDYLYLFFFIA
jgi:hypothetical protein